MRCGRTRWVAAAIVFLATAVVAGCSGSPPATAPPISAAAEVAASEVPPAFDMLMTADPVALATPVAPTAPTTILNAPATTAAAASDDDDGGDPRGHEALALIAYPWRRMLPGWSIHFLPARVGLRGLTKVDGRRIEVYVREDDSAASLSRIVAHELGHAVDVELNSPSDRERWRAARSVGPGVAWWPANAMSDFDTLAGDFAEAFATWLTGSVSQSRVAPQPGPAELALLAELASNR